MQHLCEQGEDKGMVPPRKPKALDVGVSHICGSATFLYALPPQILVSSSTLPSLALRFERIC